MIVTYAPLTLGATAETPGNISVLARMKVTFTVKIDKATVTDQTFKIDGITGKYEFSEGNDTEGYSAVELIPKIQEADLRRRAVELLGDAYSRLGRLEHAADAYRGILR